MKTNFKNFAFIFLFSIFLFSCQSDNDNIVEEIKEEYEFLDYDGDLLSSAILDDKGDEPIEIGQVRTYTVEEDFPEYRWSIESGEHIEVIGETNEKSFTVKFNEGFTEAKINVLFGHFNVTFGVEK